MTHELMIGNWVMYKGETMVVASVQSLFCELFGINDSPSNTVLVYSEDLSPIPITPEWLEKLGFENKKIFGGVIQVNGNIECYIEPTDGKITFYFRYKELPNIAYIHQIQNLITILNGKK